jgi:NAD(P)-dependent dehydrogenase (short-subunit alcohol dehydrogenase family)
VTHDRGRLEGKVALITGAASGMGRTASLLFAKEGAKVMVADISSNGEETAATIEAAGGDGAFVVADVADEAQVESMVEQTISRFGRLDVLYNNAGIGPPDDAAIHELPTGVWDRVMNVNVRGMYLCCRYGICAMLAQPEARGASIVNTASVAISYAAHGIRCNAVCPGPILTPILEPFFDEPGVRERFEAKIPIGRIGQPEDVANLALFLASDESSFITGALIVIDGGVTSA